MAIGNAPWPIGVTMVGIHARTGREKIFAQHVARILFETSIHCFCDVAIFPLLCYMIVHSYEVFFLNFQPDVLNDETQRKYIQVSCSFHQ